MHVQEQQRHIRRRRVHDRDVPALEAAREMPGGTNFQHVADQQDEMEVDLAPAPRMARDKLLERMCKDYMSKGGKRGKGLPRRTRGAVTTPWPP